jgi:hypothetical protein
MTTIEARISTQAKRSNPSTAAKSNAIKKAPAAQRDAVASKTSKDRHAAGVTKHERVLTLLSRREGATIPEMIEATGWQQHSVRGFLAGTVKKKLGCTLTSSKIAGELRRYRIDTKHGR